jgi:hypothetical protein
MRYLELYDPGLAMMRAARRRASRVAGAVAARDAAPIVRPVAAGVGPVALAPSTARPTTWSDASDSRRAA